MSKLAGGLMAVVFVAAAGPSAVCAQENGGEASIWGQYVFTENGRDGGTSSCSGSGDFCEDVGGIGAYLGYNVSIQNNWSLYADLTLDYHKSTATGGGDTDEDGFYAGAGFHIINESTDNPWGIFGVLAAGESNADEDDAGPVFALGAEKRFGKSYLQGGYMELIKDSDESDTLDDMLFVKAGHGFELGNGTLDTSLAYGHGDFDDDSEHDDGKWIQLALRYEAPLRGMNMNWFVGYQGDYVKVDRGSDHDKATFHSLQLGIKIPFGGKKRTPFKTPNFRAPLVNADEMN